MTNAGANLTLTINAANLPDVIEDTTGRACPPRGGTILDPRPEYHEHHASFSVFQKDGVWFYKRRGGPGDHGTTWHFLLSLGWDDALAAEYLTSRYGDPDASAEELEARRLVPRLTPLERALQHAELWTPLTPAEARRAWADTVPLTPAALTALHARGLAGSPVLQAASVTPGRYGTQGGAVAFALNDPQGRLVAVKVRNPPGTEPRYVLRTDGRGAPPWCSPRYGRAGTVLIVEGELNAAAAAHAAHVTGLDVDVQGLPGGDTSPYTDGLDRDVLLYLDDDDGHEAAEHRLTEIALGCAARTVHRLPPLPRGMDFCDVLGTQGPAALADLIRVPEAAEPTFPPSTVTLLNGAASYDRWPLMPSRAPWETPP